MTRFASLVLCMLGCGDNVRPVASCRAAGQDEVAPGAPTSAAYDDLVLADTPVAFWDINGESGIEPDLTGNGNTGTYRGRPPLTAMPNGDPAADFQPGQYLAIRSNASLSIPTTGSLTWEAWLKPDSLERDYPGGYVNWMGKCANHAPTCEWEARFHDARDAAGACNRFSAYVFNPTAGLGAGASWQPVCGLLQACDWHHVVGEYTIARQPDDCPSAPMYPGSIDIWVDGVEWNQAEHTPTGCMSQFDVAPVANDSPMYIGTSAGDTWFDGAIGKVAIYGYLLRQDQIASHYHAMTGRMPTGSCGDTCTTGE